MSHRNTLPQRRASETFDVNHNNQRCVVTTGYYDDGSLGEVFITAPKAGSELEAIARDGAVLLSIALQYSVPLSVIAGAVTRGHDDKPSSLIGAVIDMINGERCPAE